jgi:hypothetical protein
MKLSDVRLVSRLRRREQAINLGRTLTIGGRGYASASDHLGERCGNLCRCGLHLHAFAGPYRGGCFVGFADTSVHFISKQIDPSVMEAMMTISGGEAIDVHADE